jgi:hypothetical protein
MERKVNQANDVLNTVLKECPEEIGKVTFQQGYTICQKVQAINKALPLGHLTDYSGEYPVPQYTTIQVSLDSLSSDAISVRSKFDSIIDQLHVLFDKEYNVSQIQTDLSLENIEDLIKFLNSELTDQDFQNDSILSEYGTIKGSLI